MILAKRHESGLDMKQWGSDRRKKDNRGLDCHQGRHGWQGPGRALHDECRRDHRRPADLFPQAGGL